MDWLNILIFAVVAVGCYFVYTRVIREKDTPYVGGPDSGTRVGLDNPRRRDPELEDPDYPDYPA